MLATLQKDFLFVIAVAFLGWLMEVTCKSLEYKRFINRGFLIGPWCPIYGVGSLLIVLLLDGYADSPVTVFLLGMIVCGVLEYLTSYLLEKIFHARWWDYSRRRFNLNICNLMIPTPQSPQHSAKYSGKSQYFGRFESELTCSVRSLSISNTKTR